MSYGLMGSDLEHVEADVNQPAISEYFFSF